MVLSCCAEFCVGTKSISPLTRGKFAPLRPLFQALQHARAYFIAGEKAMIICAVHITTIQRYNNPSSICDWQNGSHSYGIYRVIKKRPDSTFYFLGLHCEHREWFVKWFTKWVTQFANSSLIEQPLKSIWIVCFVLDYIPLSQSMYQNDKSLACQKLTLSLVAEMFQKETCMTFSENPRSGEGAVCCSSLHTTVGTADFE